MNADVYRLTLRSLVRGKRSLALAVVPLIPALLALGASLSGTQQPPQTVYAWLMERLFLPSAAAFVALVLGASALGDERDEGTILYLAATPLRRLTIALSKVAAAWTAVLALCLPGLGLCIGLALGGAASAGAIAWSLAALLATTLAYTAAFALLSLVFRRPVVIGFLYIVFWEGSIASVAASADKFSIAAYGRALVAGGLPEWARYNVPAVSVATALAVLAGVTAVATWWAGRRLARVELP